MKILNSRSFPFCLLFFSTIAHSYHWDGNKMYDLEYQSSDFDAEAASWTPSQPLVTSGMKTSQCGPNTILGGFNIMGFLSFYFGAFYKTYSALPTHNTITFQGKFYLVDSWDVWSDTFHLYFDSADITMWYILLNYNYAATNLWGNPSYKDLEPITIYFTVPHTANSLTFKMAQQITRISSQQSVGFRDITMTFSTVNPVPPMSYCGVTSGFPLPYGVCSCDAGTLMYPSNSGKCGPCHGSCATCNGAGSSKCTSCAAGNYLNNGACSQCDSSCKTCNGAGPSVCTTCELPKRLNNGYCYECDVSCLTCSGPGPTACTSCKTGEFLTGGGSCSQCDNSCAACSGTTSSDCTACPEGEYLSGGSCYGCDFACVTCTTAGSSGCSSCSGFQYLDNGVCKSCDFSCQTCNGAGSLACTSCPAGKYLDNGACSQCDSSCQNCNGAGPSQCTFCANGKFLTNGVCSGCDNSCKVCHAAGPSSCISCPDGRYFDNGYCLECDSTCKTCNGAGPGKCTSCRTADYSVGGTSCYPSCESPLVKSSSGSVNYCDTPCTAGEYAYLEGGCGACDYPRSQITMNSFYVCAFPCVRNDLYFYWNGSCFEDCPSPLSKGVIGTQNSCEFPCGATNFVYWDGSCENNCPSLLISETLGTYESRKFCWFPCQTNQYLYWNGSCLNTCPLPLSESTSKGQKFCNFPCSVTSDFVYWDGSCKTACPMPLISETQGSNEPRKFCWSPCQPDKFVYWNRSCFDDCLSPLSKVIEPNAKFCVNPCGDSSSNFLYSNQSCLSTCPYPLSVLSNPGAQYCFSSCEPSSYLYENQTCLNTCSSPFLKRIEPANIQYCDRPCSQPNIYWYQNASCLSHCQFPYIQLNYSGVIQCLPPCIKESEYFYVFEKECKSKCESPFKIELMDIIRTCKSSVDISLEETTKIQDTSEKIKSQGAVTSGGIKAASALNSANPSSALLAGLSSILQYIRYMKINYPAKVQMLFLVSAGNPISLGFDFEIPEFIEEKLVVDYSLPEVFEKYDINSNFIHNLWDFLATLLLTFLLIFGLIMLRFLFARFSSKVNLVLTRLLEAVKWNFPLMMICGSSGDIFFYAALQIRSSPLDNRPSIICFIICVLMIMLVLFILGTAYRILRSFENQRIRIQIDNTLQNNWADRWKGYEILYEEYEENSRLSFSYMSLFILRGLIFNLTIANLFDYPLIQCIIINMANLSMFGYLLYLRPLKSLLNLVQLFINEGLVNVLGISVLILAIMDKAGIRGQSTRNGVGQVILFVIKTFNTFGLVFMGIELLVFLVVIFKIWRNFRAKGIKSPVKMLKALVFGKEEEGMKKSPEDSIDDKKKPKILKPLRRLSTMKDSNFANEIIFVDSEMTLGLDKSSIVSNISHVESDLQLIDLNSMNQKEVSLEKSEITLVKEKEVSADMGSGSGGNSSIVQSWRSIEERMQRTGQVSSDVDSNYSWFESLRKLKRRLRSNLNKINVVLESKKNGE